MFIRYTSIPVVSDINNVSSTRIEKTYISLNIRFRGRMWVDMDEGG